MRSTMPSGERDQSSLRPVSVFQSPTFCASMGPNEVQ